MDFGPFKRARDKSDRYHFWDFDSDSRAGPHPLTLLPARVLKIELSGHDFLPSEFVSWKPNWYLPRDWGEYS